MKTLALLGLLLIVSPLSASNMLDSYPYLDKCLVARIETVDASYVSIFYDCQTASRKYEMITLVPTIVSGNAVLLERPISYVLLDRMGRYIILDDPAQDGLNNNEIVTPVGDTAIGIKV